MLATRNLGKTAVAAGTEERARMSPLNVVVPSTTPRHAAVAADCGVGADDGA